LNGHRSLLGFESKGNVNRQILGKLNLYEHPLYTRQGFSSEGLTRRTLSWRFQEGVRGTKVCQTTSFENSGGRRCVKRCIFFVSCFGHTSLSESSRRRSKLLPAVQTSNFQEQTNMYIHNYIYINILTHIHMPTHPHTYTPHSSAAALAPPYP